MDRFGVPCTRLPAWYPYLSKEMAKVTSKYQVTVPKAIAQLYGIRPGDEIEWVPAGETIRVVPLKRSAGKDIPAERLRRFRQATVRQSRREKEQGPLPTAKERGWTREELYQRGRPR